MSKGGEQNVEAGCTKDHNTSTPSLKESDQSGDYTGVSDTLLSLQKESDQSGSGAGVNDTTSLSLTHNSFWRNQTFWILIAILGTIQLYVFSFI